MNLSIQDFPAASCSSERIRVVPVWRVLSWQNNPVTDTSVQALNERENSKGMKEHLSLWGHVQVYKFIHTVPEVMPPPAVPVL